MKNTKFILPVGLLVCLLLPSCNLFGGETIEIQGAVSYQMNDDGTRTYQHSIDTAKMLSNSGIDALPATGEQKILVVPVSFQKNGHFTKVPSLGYSNYREALDKMFFGEAEDTYWQSVKSYYSTSSYGKLNLTGEVVQAIELQNTFEYYCGIDQSTSNIASLIAETVINNLELSGFDTTIYDQDKDGYIDALWLVYDSPYQAGANTNDLAWAFTTTSWRTQKNLSAKVKSFCWASYYFMGSINDSLPDAHTFIHETGHILGLDDYYNYDANLTNQDSPLGGLDMMDYNIGDHTAFSKYLLNWISPREIMKTGEYRLNSFEQSGDALLISPSFNGTPFDEYIMLEYYTPEGLNFLDSSQPYNGLSMFKQSGLRITHVDNRLGDIKVGTFTGRSWSGKYYDTVDYYIKNGRLSLPVASNTPSSSYNKNNRLIELYSSQCNCVPYKLASDQDLFKQNSEIKNISFNDGNVLPYTIKIKEINSEYITLLIEE